MSVTSTTITSNGTDVLLKRYCKNTDKIHGLIEIGGTFGGGVLSLKTSLSGGEVINGWFDESGEAYTTTENDTFEFNLPVTHIHDETIRLYYTLNGAVSPNITLTIGDNL